MMKGFSLSSFVSGIMLGALLTGAWFFNGNTLFVPPPASATVSGFSSDAAATSSPSDAISVNDQAAGLTVQIESVTVPPPGVWVAVREVNGNDLGNVLGAARVDGPRSDISIPLLRSTEPGLPYAIELYRDDGGETFDLTNDSQYVDFSTGAPVIARFMTTN